LKIAGYGRFVMLSDAKAVREVFRGDPDVLHSGEANEVFTATAGRHWVVVLDGATDLRQRRVLVPPLKGDRMRVFFDAMRLETMEAVRTWRVGEPFAAPGWASPPGRGSTRSSENSRSSWPTAGSGSGTRWRT
jgi:cytochrome P450